MTVNLNFLLKFTNLLRALFLSVVLVLTTNISFGQDYIVEIAQALKNGNASKLAEHFDQNIDLSFSEITKTYSKKQSILILQNFFSKIEPSLYVINQTGKSNYNNTKYCIGKLSTSNGEYKVYMFFITKNGVPYLKELRFEK